MTDASLADDNARMSPGIVPLRVAVRTWLRIALLSFGGPAGQIAVMHRILVEEKKWISEARFLHALNFCMVLPGPEAQQLATYIGWLMHRTPGGLVAGGLFILPGVIAIMGLSWIYVAFGSVGAVGGLFFGLKAAVIAIVLQAVVRIGRRTLKSPAMVALAVAAFLALFALDLPFPLVIAAAAVIGVFGARSGHPAFATQSAHGPASAAEQAPPAERQDATAPSLSAAAAAAWPWLLLWLLPVAGLYAILGDGNVFTEIAVFFSKMAMVTFGGAYAVLAYVAQEAVGTFGWLEPGEMLDGLGLAETTPGPLIMVLQFVGFLAAFRDPGSLPPYAAATLGGLLATWVTFVPCFLWIFLGAPFVEALRGNKIVAAALAAITAAVVGVIANLALWFFMHTVFRSVTAHDFGLVAVDLPDPRSIDLAALLLSAAAAIAVFRFQLGMIPTIAGAVLGGLALHLAGVT